jgi:hypothetical protein
MNLHVPLQIDTLEQVPLGGPIPQSHSSTTGPSTSAIPSTSAAPSSTSSYFVMRSTPGGQPSIQSLIKKKETEEADKLVAKCFLWSDIPFNIANNPFYHPMFEVVAIVGQGPFLSGFERASPSRGKG